MVGNFIYEGKQLIKKIMYDTEFVGFRNKVYCFSLNFNVSKISLLSS